MEWMAPAPGVAAPQWCCHAARTWSHRDGDHDCRHRPGEECLPGARYRRSRRSPRPTSAKAGSGGALLPQACALPDRYGGLRNEPSLGARDVHKAPSSMAATAERASVYGYAELTDAWRFGLSLLCGGSA